MFSKYDFATVPIGQCSEYTIRPLKFSVKQNDLHVTLNWKYNKAPNKKKKNLKPWKSH